MAPFLADKQISQQGFLSSEPYVIMQAGVQPVVHLIADAGFDNYQTTINISKKMVDEKKDVVQRFVNATAEGWAEYMKGGPAIEAANAAIRKDNPDMTDDKMAYALKVMNERGIVKSGDAAQARHRRDDRRALEALLRDDGRGRRVPDGHRLPQGLQPRVREQGRRRVTMAAVAGADSRTRPLVAIRNVSKQFANGTLAIRGVDLDLRDGEFVSLLGPSGCGKSTLLRIIAGLGAPSAGTLDWPTAPHSASGEPQPDLGFVFQDPTLMPWATRSRT